MSNKYVPFVSDAHFLTCVRQVCGSYTALVQRVNVEDLDSNGLDPFKIVFDIVNRRGDLEKWSRGEAIRQADKTLNNKIGEFHQKLLGGVKGWSDLGTGHKTGVDLKNNGNTIFIELKNKHNTVKGSDLKHVFDILKAVAQKNKNSLAYYAYIIPKKPGSGEKIWATGQRKPFKRVKEVWGGRVYEIVTGNPQALKMTWEALPKAIAEVVGLEHPMKPEDKHRLLELFQKMFQ